MTKNTQTPPPAPGASEAMKEAINPTIVKDLLIKDLSLAVHCLNAILTDGPLLDTMAHFMAGRWQNFQDQKSNPPA